MKFIAWPCCGLPLAGDCYCNDCYCEEDYDCGCEE